jgi:hypothetical protein
MDLATFVCLLQTEITGHSFDTFVDEPPSVAQGGRGVVCTRLCHLRGQSGNDESIPSGDRTRTSVVWFDDTVSPRPLLLSANEFISFRWLQSRQTCDQRAVLFEECLTS